MMPFSGTSRAMPTVAIAALVAVLFYGEIEVASAYLNANAFAMNVALSAGLCVAAIVTAYLISRLELIRPYGQILVVVPLVVAAIASSSLTIGLIDRFASGGAIVSQHAIAAATTPISLASAFNFLAATICALAAYRQSFWSARVLVATATLGVCISSAALVGHMVDPQALRSSAGFPDLSANSAILFAMIFASFMLAETRFGWVWTLFGPAGGSIGARRLFPVVVGGPLLLSIFGAAATKAGIFDPSAYAAHVTVCMMAIGIVAVLVNAHNQNVAEAKLVDAISALEIANADKQILLQEVYHRVKNNLQQVDVLLWLEARKYEDEKLKASFSAMSSRIQAVGLVHHLLIDRQNLATISLSEFLGELCERIEKANGLEERNISLDLQCGEHSISLSTATTIGLIINEIAANSIKHAFMDRAGGNISISYAPCKEDPAFCRLRVSDDGIGFDEDKLQHGRSGGTGSLLIRSLARQLGGTLKMVSDCGTHIDIRLARETAEKA